MRLARRLLHIFALVIPLLPRVWTGYGLHSLMGVYSDLGSPHGIVKHKTNSRRGLGCGDRRVTVVG